MLREMDNAHQLAEITKSFYKEAIDRGYGDLFISELIKKN